jgi:cold shock CspA family protein
MQGTVCAFVAETRSGAVLLDDGSRLGFDASAFDSGGLRLLRPGQRVRLEAVTHDSVITVLRVQLLTVPQA